MTCRHHATWMKDDDPTFAGIPELKFLQKSWDKLQEQERKGGLRGVLRQTADDTRKRLRHGPFRCLRSASCRGQVCRPTEAYGTRNRSIRCRCRNRRSSRCRGRRQYRDVDRHCHGY